MKPRLDTRRSWGSIAPRNRPGGGFNIRFVKADGNRTTRYGGRTKGEAESALARARVEVDAAADPKRGLVLLPARATQPAAPDAPPIGAPPPKAPPSTPPAPRVSGTPDAGPLRSGADLTVEELLCAYERHAEGYYCGHDGKATSEQGLVKNALRVVRILFGGLPAMQFGPKRLRECRESLIDCGQCRTVVNSNTNRIRRAFRWGVGQELLPGDIIHALDAVEGLKVGRCRAPEGKGRGPVSDDHLRLPGAGG